MKTVFIIILFFAFISCNKKDKEKSEEEKPKNSGIEIGGDFSIMKNMEDSGGVYKINGIAKEGFRIFKDNGYTWARLRIFHTPDMHGPVCNDLEYTIELAKKAKQ